MKKSIRKGFTIVEMLMVMGIIAVLLGLVSTAAMTAIRHARDRKAVGAKVVKAANEKLKNGKLTLSDETGDFLGGLILRRGNIEANCTAELLVELCRGDMAAELAKVLFG